MFIGIDANVAALHTVSGRAAREGRANLLYVRAAVETLPSELAGVADEVTVVLPWGSLLAAVAGPSVPALAGIRALCQPRARLTVVFSLAERDHAEAHRLGLRCLDPVRGQAVLGESYAAAGWRLASVRALETPALARWPTTWAKRLAFGQPRPVFQLEAVHASAG